LRKHERPRDTFETFKAKALKAVLSYPEASGKELIGSMAKRVQKVIELDGGMCGK
jgi:hypothetical protein